MNTGSCVLNRVGHGRWPKSNLVEENNDDDGNQSRSHVRSAAATAERGGGGYIDESQREAGQMRSVCDTKTKNTSKILVVAGDGRYKFSMPTPHEIYCCRLVWCGMTRKPSETGRCSHPLSTILSLEYSVYRERQSSNVPRLFDSKIDRGALFGEKNGFLQDLAQTTRVDPQSRTMIYLAVVMQRDTRQSWSK